MNHLKYILPLIIILTLLTGCKVAMKEGGELINTSMNVVQEENKSLWSIHRDSTGKNYELYGVHKIKYSEYKYLGKRKFVVEFFDINGEYIDTNSEMGFAKEVTFRRKNNIIEKRFLNSKNNLVNHKILKYAKIKTIHFKDGSWQDSYINSENKPFCLNGVSEQRKTYDTILFLNGRDTSYALQLKLLNAKKCN